MTLSDDEQQRRGRGKELTFTGITATDGDRSWREISEKRADPGQGATKPHPAGGSVFPH
jgi:hypothetical protein